MSNVKIETLKKFEQIEQFNSIVEDYQIVNMLVFDRLDLIEEAYRQVQSVEGIYSDLLCDA